ncbi:c-type cytochrome [Marivita sp. S6314]|uniref:c-type cytochrome n=1 Tax=Marivita sp. S6314 TaxID=2926406 RepID=UPI001FF4C884|nr:c-type cytochrome [Marivita sp. S6314]MCK0150329.1 c-type cytochrome [Marivita sp. S6314]
MRKTIAISMLASFALGAVFVVASGWTAHGSNATLPYTDSDRIAEGAALYQSYCASCHGENLEGQPDWKLRDADGFLPAPPHDASGHTWHHDDALLMRIVRDGTEAIVGGSYKSNMQGYADLLSDAEIASILGYIKSTWPAEIQQIHNDINARKQP